MDKVPCDSGDVEVRKGPWTMEEDSILINHIANHGEAGAWNSLAKAAGLKRTGKSCRLRWLNYLRPDLRRGNITPEEQLLIMELHAKWGNRWSKIAKHLPGRTDNEIKNYWRTRIQKHNKQAEKSSYEISNRELHDQQSGTSQVPRCITTQFLPCTPAEYMESYEPSSSSSSFNHLHGSNMGTLTGHATMSSMVFESNQSYWGMEDMMWSEPDPCTLFGGDHTGLSRVNFNFVLH